MVQDESMVVLNLSTFIAGCFSKGDLTTFCADGTPMFGKCSMHIDRTRLTSCLIGKYPIWAGC